jgi:hypothetical protein
MHAQCLCTCCCAANQCHPCLREVVSLLKQLWLRHVSLGVAHMTGGHVMLLVLNMPTHCFLVPFAQYATL